MSTFSSIQLDKKSLQKNINFIRSTIGENSEFVSVIKGNAYGHGIEVFVPLLHKCGVKSFAVFNSEEARRVVSTGISFDRLMIMGAIHDADLPWAIENNIDCYVFTKSRLVKGLEIAKKLRKQFRIHIEVETGMNRTGFELTELNEVIQTIKDNRKHFRVEGICTHLAGAEEISNYLRIRKQLEVFNEAKKTFRKNRLRFEHAHIACSAAIINYPETIGTLVRVGILQYGFWPSKEVKMAYLARENTLEDPLKRVISWKSSIMSVKKIKAGSYVGYGLSFLSESPMTIATVPIGYSNGFSRALSNRGKVLVHGKRVDVIGIVNMNLLTIDVTSLKNVEEGDEVVLIGTQRKQSITVASFSDFSSLLNYQLLTRLPERIPRKIK